MKNMLILFLMFVPFVASADLNLDLEMLDREIERLTQERDKKYSDLIKCEKNTHNFKISGLATLAGTGLGVYGNIKLSKKLNSQDGGTSVKENKTPQVDNRSREEIDAASCIQIGCPPDPIECEKCLDEED